MDPAADPTDKECFEPSIDRVANQGREFDPVFKDCELGAVPSRFFFASVSRSILGGIAAN